MTKEEIEKLQKRCEAYRQELFKAKEELALLKGEDILFNGKIVKSENERLKAELLGNPEQLKAERDSKTTEYKLLAGEACFETLGKVNDAWPDVSDKAEMEWISEMTKALFWSKYGYSEGCWLWNGSRNKDGYGTFRINGKAVLSHRIAYSIISGIPLNEINQVCHHCDTPSCGNPKHLFHSDHIGNMLDKQIKFRGGGKLSQSKYMGVCWRKDCNKWRAIIRHNNKYKSLGSFDTEKEAAIAYDKSFIEIFKVDKSYNKLNFPELPKPPKQ